jgi:hypothetical protein
MPAVRQKCPNDRVLLRIPKGIADLLRATAEKESRTLSGQVLHYLKQAMRMEKEAQKP